MLIKPIDVFSFYKQVVIAIKTEDLDVDLNKKHFKKMLEKNPPYIKNNVNRITSEIYSNLYTFDEFKLMVLTYYLYNKKTLNLSFINFKESKIIKLMYTQDSLKRDREMILSLKQDIPFDDLSLFFKFNSNDVSFLYEFITQRLITPMFWLRYVEERYFKNLEFIETDHHKLFRFVMELIKKVINNS